MKSGSSGSDEPASAPAPERRDIDSFHGVENSLDVATKSPTMGEQVVGEQHWLCPLKVCVARQVDVAGSTGPVEQHRLQVDDSLGDHHQLAFHPPPYASGRLIISTATGVQLGAGRPGELRHAAFDRRVDVFVAVDERERAGDQLVADAVRERR